MKPFRAARGGDVVARLDPAEAGVVGLLLDQLEQLLEADAEDVGGDPVMARLLPDGHRGDPELAADYRDLTEASLRSGKADDLAMVRATLPPDGGEVRLDAEQAGAWLRTSNDLRLAMGTRLEPAEAGIVGLLLAVLIVLSFGRRDRRPVRRRASPAAR